MKQEKASSKKIFFWLLLVAFLWIAVTYFAKTEQILKVLSTGRWYFIGLAVVLQIFYYPFYAYFLESIFKIFKINLGIRNILPVYIASKFTDVRTGFWYAFTH